MNVNGEKRLIELFGDFWHKGQDPADRAKHFAKFGFATVVIWENQVRDEARIVCLIGGRDG